MTPEPDDTGAIEPDHVVHPFTLPDDGEDGVPGSGGAEDPLAALLGGGGGGAGGLDFGALMEQAAALQSQMLAAQEQVAETLIEGVSGGGVVRISVTGGLDFQSVSIDASAVDPADVDMLQDLVLAALRHAVEQINDLQSGGGLDLGGLGLGDLFGGS
ncbi:MAG: YbaB/EbfC family nucleoid-associated protein [Acidimicrobiales bacterium]